MAARTASLAERGETRRAGGGSRRAACSAERRRAWVSRFRPTRWARSASRAFSASSRARAVRKSDARTAFGACRAIRRAASSMSVAVIGRTGLDGHGAIDLLGQHGAGQGVRPGLRARRRWSRALRRPAPGPGRPRRRSGTPAAARRRRASWAMRSAKSRDRHALPRSSQAMTRSPAAARRAGPRPRRPCRACGPRPRRSRPGRARAPGRRRWPAQPVAGQRGLRRPAEPADSGDGQLHAALDGAGVRRRWRCGAGCRPTRSSRSCRRRALRGGTGGRSRRPRRSAPSRRAAGPRPGRGRSPRPSARAAGGRPAPPT